MDTLDSLNNLSPQAPISESFLALTPEPVVSWGEGYKNLHETGDSQRLSPLDRLYRAAPRLGNLALELIADMPEKRWSMVVAEGVSARIPALAIRGILRRRAIDTGMTPPRLAFLSPKRLDLVFDRNEDGGFMEVVTSDNNITELDGYIGAHADTVAGRALLMTDFIHRGTTIEVLGELLHRHGIDYDLAALAGDHYGERQHEQLREHNVSYYAGDNSYELPAVNEFMYATHTDAPRLRSAIGVEKNKNRPLPKVNRKNMPDVTLLRRGLYGTSEEPGLIDKIYQQLPGAE